MRMRWQANCAILPRDHFRLLIRRLDVKCDSGRGPPGGVCVLDPALRAGARAYFGPRPLMSGGPATRCLMG
jgi:hypothetical protein